MSSSFTVVQDALIQIGIPREEIRADVSLLHDLSVDSTELIEVITVIEGQTGLSLDARQLKNIHTVSELIAFVDSYQSQLAS
jgi:acyl carrier protein